MVLTISVILAIYLVHISAEDIRTREISNFAPFIIIAASPFLNELSFSERITGLLALFVTLFAANLIADIGMGDVKLCAALGFALGAVPEFIAVLLALISAKLYGYIKKEHELPLAPFICAANAAVFLSEVFLNA